MSTLYLIRHGQASFGASDYDNLSAQGNRQSRALGDFLVRAGIRFDACWTGSLKRHLQTVAAVRDGYQQAGLDLPAGGETTALDEYDYESVLRALIPIMLREDPAFTEDVNVMLSDQRAFQAVFARVMRRWASGRDRLDAMPTWSAFCGRVTTGITGIMSGCASGSHVAVFTSGGPIAAVVGNILELAPQKTIALSWQLANASITRLKFSPRGIGLDTFNEKGHLEQSDGGNSQVTYR